MTGVLTTTEQTSILTPTEKVEVRSLAIHNTSGSECWVKGFLNAVQAFYVRLGANEITHQLVHQERLLPSDNLALQAQSSGVLSWRLMLS